MRTIKIIEPKGYCSGVINAIKIAKKAKDENPDNKVILFGMLVHNQRVINDLNDYGIECIEDNTLSKKELLKSLPDDVVLVFSAHGHADELDQIAKEKNMKIYDATCPKVKKNLEIIKEAINNDKDVIYIGQKGHPECDAALSISNRVSLYDTNLLNKNYKNTNNNPIVINQTTLNILELKNIYIDIKAHYSHALILDEICASTRLRQEALKGIPLETDLIIVVGDKRSSNTNRLFDIAKTIHPHIDSLMISSKDELDINCLKNKKYIVISSGASTSPDTINDILNVLN